MVIIHLVTLRVVGSNPLPSHFASMYQRRSELDDQIM
jgi:hypothetical protein